MNAKQMTVSILLLFLFVSCERSKPEETVIRYLNNTQAAQFEEIYNDLCAADMKDKDQLQFVGDIPFEQIQIDDVLKAMAGRTTYEIRSSEQHDDSAVVRVARTAPDQNVFLGRVMIPVVKAYLASLGGKPDANAIIQESIRKMIAEVPNTPLKTEELLFDLVREDREWRMNLHLDTISRLSKDYYDAKRLEDHGQFEEAEKVYNDLLKREPRFNRAKNSLLLLQSKLDAIKLAKPYINKLSFDFIKLSNNTSKDTVSIQVKIRNKGDKTIKQIWVAYRLIGKYGEISEEDHRVADFTKEGGLKPNVVWQGENSFYEAIPPWKGKYEVKVVNLEFE